MKHEDKEKDMLYVGVSQEEIKLLTEKEKEQAYKSAKKVAKTAQNLLRTIYPGEDGLLSPLLALSALTTATAHIIDSGSKTGSIERMGLSVEKILTMQDMSLRGKVTALSETDFEPAKEETKH